MTSQPRNAQHSEGLIQRQLEKQPSKKQAISHPTGHRKSQKVTSNETTYANIPDFGQRFTVKISVNFAPKSFMLLFCNVRSVNVWLARRARGISK